MTAKHLADQGVEFLATSSRLADAYRSAAKRNKTLARCASIRELGHAGRKVDAARPTRPHPIVILSHADDDQLALTKATRGGPLVTGAFHLLFTEPATHPDQVAQWMRATKIRSENRLHVVRVETLEAPHVADLLGRVCAAFGPDGVRGPIIDAYLAGGALLVRGPKHRMLHVPLSALTALARQPHAALRNFQIDPDGSFVYWPDLGVHLGWNQFLQAANPAELHKAQQRSADFNRRYGAAIRKAREAAGIPQAKIEGLTDRQVRRVEQGTCRATAGALAAFAKAHGLDVDVYMDKLTNALP